MKALVTGASGFIGGYLVHELLEHGWEVIGLDNHSKYGPISHPHDTHPSYRLVTGDAKDSAMMAELAQECDQLVAGAAMIGGISYFHAFAYDLLAENERILGSTFDAAIRAQQAGKLQRIVVLSSSMVYENATNFPTPEGEQLSCPPPSSTYGFQKLAAEYYARGAREQYGLTYTILRPFNCVGIGERRALADSVRMSGNYRLALSHVLPDLVLKALLGQNPLHILGDGSQVRCYTYGGDLARGIRMAMESPAAVNEDFNLSTSRATSVRELAELIWARIHPGTPLRLAHDDSYPYDVKYRVPATEKAARVLGYSADTPLESVIDEVIAWIRERIDAGEMGAE